MIKKSFLFIFLFQQSFADFNNYKCKENYNENEYLNEFADKFLYPSDIDHNLCFCGNLNFNSVFVDQKIKFDEPQENLTALGNLNLKYLGSNDGMGYGFELNTKISSGKIKKGRPIIDSSFIFLEMDKIGKIQLGFTESAASRFCINGGDVLVGYKSFGSNNLSSFYNHSTGSIIGTENPINDKNSAKVLWISPTIKGFTIGASYSISEKNNSFIKSENKTVRNGKKYYNCSDSRWNFYGASPYSKNTFTIGTSYEHGSLDDVFYKFSVSGWIGKGKTDKENFSVNDVKAIHIGAMFGYKNLKISSGFTNNGKSLIASPKNQNFNFSRRAGKQYSLGVSYAISKKLEISVGTLYSAVKFSEKEKSTAKILSFASEYSIKGNIKVYTEYDRIRTKSCDAALQLARVTETLPEVSNNRANIFMIGMKIEF